MVHPEKIQSVKGMKCLEKIVIEEVYPQRLRYNTKKGEIELSRIKTKRGYWEVYGRPKLDANDFCAVYYRHGKPRTMFTGSTTDVSSIEKTINTLTSGVLEGVHTSNFFNPKTLVVSESLGLGTALTMIMYPKFPLWFTAPVMIASAAYFSACLLLSNNKINVPENFKYGKDALWQVLSEEFNMQEGTLVREVYDKAKAAGVDMTFEDFRKYHTGIRDAGAEMKHLTQEYGAEKAIKIAQVYSQPAEGIIGNNTPAENITVVEENTRRIDSK